MEVCFGWWSVKLLRYLGLSFAYSRHSLFYEDSPVVESLLRVCAALSFNLSDEIDKNKHIVS